MSEEFIVGLDDDFTELPEAVEKESAPDQQDDYKLELTVSDEKSRPKKEPKLPEGIGLSSEVLADILDRADGRSLESDDSISNLVTVCNFFLAEVNKLQDRNNAALAKIMATGTQEYLENVKKIRNEIMPELPDGIGISFEDIGVLLSLKHDNNVSKDDPVLMMVSICNVFLGEVQKLHQQHNKALTTIIASETKNYVDSVKNTSDAFTKTLSEASIEGIRAIFDKHASTLYAVDWNARWCAAVVGLSALINVAALAWIGFK